MANDGASPSPGEGSVALVAGAGSGMGQLAAQRLAHDGAKVAALDVNEEGLRQTISGQARIASCRLSDPASRRPLGNHSRISA